MARPRLDDDALPLSSAHGERGRFAGGEGATSSAIEALARIAAGPLALAGFFLPWAQGPGILAGKDFTGFTLVAFTGRLQQLDLSISASAVLLVIRIAILLVAVAATWMTLLGPRHSWHRAYPVAGSYVTTVAGIAVAIGLLKSGLVMPPLGLALWIAGAGLFVLATLLGRLSSGQRSTGDQ